MATTLVCLIRRGQKDMDGIVYLHGKVTSDYQGAKGDGFVLSSPQFGQAYLSEGWATSFFREIIDRYVVVFVGYAADDPPVQYLLEGLNRQFNERQVYAFQQGDADEADSKWRDKGVQAISYTEDSDHAALWDTLEAWADRARDPDKWYAEVINKAKAGASKPFRRMSAGKLPTSSRRLRGSENSQREKNRLRQSGCVFSISTGAMVNRES